MRDIISAFGAEPVEICRTLQEAGHDAVIVGGPVRDYLRGKRPSDVDIATSATPDQIRKVFRRTFVQGKGEIHGTIGVVGRSGEKYEVTTYRLDLVTDGRHAEVAFTDSLLEDLQRRDFTINAIAFRPQDDGSGELIDPFGGQEDLRSGVLRAVGDPITRFAEDHLRVLRGYRFAARFGFAIDPATRSAMARSAPLLRNVSMERIRDEMAKMAMQAIDREAIIAALEAMRADGALEVFLPELARCHGVTQNEHHAFDVFRHIAGAAGTAAERTRSPRQFFAALLHDIGKPATRSVGEDGRVHFFEHEIVGAEMAEEALKRLKFSAVDREWIVEAVRHHMRFMHAEKPIMSSPRAGRRALARIARDLHHLSVDDLLELRIADKSASGVDGKEVSLEFIGTVHTLMAELQAQGSAFSLADLDIRGSALMEHLGIPPGPEIGRVLRALQDDVIEERVANEHGALLSRATVHRGGPSVTAAEPSANRTPEPVSVSRRPMQ